MIELLVLLIIVGAILYLVRLAPLDGFIKQIIYVIAVVILLVYVLRNLAAFGL